MARKKSKKLVLPKEHGSWAMYLLPVLAGTFLSEPRWEHLLFAIGWFFVYLASTPLLNIIRNKRKKKQMMPWLIGYGTVAILFLLPLAFQISELLWFALAVLPFLLITVYFINQRNERALLNDLSGILILTIGGSASYYIGVQAFTPMLFALILILTAYFLGSAFYVKSLIRELKNPAFKMKSHLYHLLLLVVPFLVNWVSLIIAYLPSILRDLFTPRNGKVKPKHSGIIEIVNSAIFFVFLLIL